MAEQAALQIPEIFNFDFNDENLAKPWKENNGQDMDKYFNYGFNEETWQIYTADVIGAHATAL